MKQLHDHFLAINHNPKEMSEKLVVLKTFKYPTDAYPLMKRLEDEGIECSLGDENIVAVNPFLSNAFGGVKLNIRESDSQKALQILRLIEHENKKKEVDNDEKAKDGTIKVEMFCPKCESYSVYRQKLPVHKIILATFIPRKYLPKGFVEKEHFCSTCGHKWIQ